MAKPSHPGIYDEIGRGYCERRIPDPRIAAQIHAALGATQHIVNVGAGAGSYEPQRPGVVAVEPSRTMLAQHPPAKLVRAVAERLPFADDAFDAALAILTVHHWLDPTSGLAELRRIARRRVVFAFRPEAAMDFWLVREYFPGIAALESNRSVTVEQIAAGIDASRVEVVEVPWDCTDGFQAAYWRRPECYLDASVRASISSFAQLDAGLVSRGLRRLEADLAGGAWAERHAGLFERESMDWGYRLVVSEGKRED